MSDSGAQLTLAGPAPPAPGTQQRRILDMLIDRRWVCGQEFSREVGWAFGSRISDLRARGYVIEKRHCTHPNHRHKVKVWQYTIRR